ncbi:MAG: Rpn family recombination-promoting nuclease/putative transposase [Lachnospiraceae bacterium]|nr:Rpn family recombination-promoting nuclease/putative transposase [Lachnospiraceae bacterium]
MKTYEEKRAADLEKLQGFVLMDDEFMKKVFEDKGCVELLLQIILDRDDLHVTEHHVQHEVSNLHGRSIRMDIFAVDGDGVVYNVEVQNREEGAIPKRARYNSSLMDANVTKPGDDYEKLVESYVIFITRTDVLNTGKLICHIDRMILENNLPFSDGAHIVYINSGIRDKSRLGLLMKDFYCKKASEMHYPRLAERVRFLKEEKAGEENMSKIADEFREEGKLEALFSLVNKEIISLEQAAEVAGLSVPEFLEKKEELEVIE